MKLPTAEAQLGRTAVVPAYCQHGCVCPCHRSGVRHAIACCIKCGYGHSQIDPRLLTEHQRTCHAYDCV